jgi:hypothetical protein
MRYFLLTALLAVGCASSQDRPRDPVQPARGLVTYQGKPAAGVLVSFFRPADEKGCRPQPSYAITREDGTYSLGTYLADDGAPPGEYGVTAIWREFKIDADGEYHFKGPDKLGGRYSETIVPVIRITIDRGQTELPTIELN